VGGLDLKRDDFRWVTAQLCGAACGTNKACAVVSVLEGGYGTFKEEMGAYNRNTLSSGCVAHVEALCNHARTRQSAHAPVRPAP
tara:strand:- start:306 stop:557 length:252 start_codon:yes stop_codon:yes gene_type:complete